MEMILQPGKYVVAVSGGVDSMVLLDLLRPLSDVELVVAHFDHGIRPDSSEDRKLVEATARNFDLPFAFEAANLGKAASEATAREARYDFLRRVKNDTGAAAIVTAHHQDDMVETAIINLLRGTGRKGLSSLRSTDEIKRPLLNIPKSEIRVYAQQHALVWREDSTNQDEMYLRNYVRHRLLPRLGKEKKARLLQIINRAAETNQRLDDELLQLMPAGSESLQRQDIIRLSHAEARELMAAWLRGNGLRDFDRKALERLVVAAKTAPAGKQIDVINRVIMRIGRQDLALEHTER
jgi:tRNA(Ile)-lysidine synthetase-like protein